MLYGPARTQKHSKFIPREALNEGGVHGQKFRIFKFSPLNYSEMGCGHVKKGTRKNEKYSSISPQNSYLLPLYIYNSAQPSQAKPN